jgi:hypothetical protein
MAGRGSDGGLELNRRAAGVVGEHRDRSEQDRLDRVGDVEEEHVVGGGAGGESADGKAAGLAVGRGGQLQPTDARGAQPGLAAPFNVDPFQVLVVDRAGLEGGADGDDVVEAQDRGIGDRREGKGGGGHGRGPPVPAASRKRKALDHQIGEVVGVMLVELVEAEQLDLDPDGGGCQQVVEREREGLALAGAKTVEGEAFAHRFHCGPFVSKTPVEPPGLGDRDFGRRGGQGEEGGTAGHGGGGGPRIDGDEHRVGPVRQGVDAGGIEPEGVGGQAVAVREDRAMVKKPEVEQVRLEPGDGGDVEEKDLVAVGVSGAEGARRIGRGRGGQDPGGGGEGLGGRKQAQIGGVEGGSVENPACLRGKRSHSPAGKDVGQGRALEPEADFQATCVR